MSETHCHCHHCHAHEHAHPLLRAPGLRRIAAALMLALAAELLHAFAPEGGHVLGMALALLAVVLAGLSTYAEGLQQLRHWRLSAGALTAAAVTGAFLIGQWPEAAMVMALYALSEHLEERASARASGAMAKVLDMAPAQLEVQDEHGGWRTQPAAEVPVGALARVRPGARVALDGVVEEGASAVDEAPLTGESLPVDKKPGDSVWAGSLNLHGALTLRVTAPAGDTQLARIVRAVEQAQAERAPVQRLIDRFAAVYTPLVFALALLVAIGGTLAGWPLRVAIYRALALLVASCPCALLLATPATMMSALTLAARRGVLVKGSAHLERARLLRCLAFDKTGTLTLGAPALQEVVNLGDAEEHKARQWALALAARSNHPVARAIAAGLADEAELPAEDFE
ncbi:MAG: cation-translocating P-type ATPase, partial [Rhodocyclaceae bacterium]|nr:cation-translocating P-type ATPase [Rhodocyclaceae bacterium]